MMKQKIAILFLSSLVAGCASTAWHAQTYSDSNAVARVLHSETMRLVQGKVTPDELIPRLNDKTPIFVEDNGKQITVRDLAFTMLEEADMAKFPVKSTTSKLICCCKIKGELFRFHVAELTDENFETVMETIQHHPAPYPEPRTVQER
jgi:hypothetical protein